MRKFRCNFRCTVNGLALVGEDTQEISSSILISLYVYVRESKQRILIIALPPSFLAVHIADVLQPLIKSCIQQFYLDALV